MRKLLLSTFLLFSALYTFAGEGIEIEQINITAQKYEEKQNKAPLSVDAFDDAEIASRDITEIKDLSKYAPHIRVKADNVGNSAVIRGIAPFTTTLVNPVGVYIDGVALPTMFMQQPNLGDASRIEILKGPQGTLYGRNSESGTINIISERPDNRIKGYAGVGYYVFDTDKDPSGTQYSFGVSGPVVKDRLFLGISAAFDATDGYHTNMYNGDEKAGELDRKDISLKLRVKPSEKLDIYFSSYNFDADDAKGKFRYLNGAYATPEYTINYNDIYKQSYDGSVNSLNLSYEADGYILNSVTGYTDYKRNFSKDFDGFTLSRGLSNFDIEDDSVSEELRISKKTDHYRILAGLYAFSQNTETEFEKTFTKERRQADTKNSGYAVFGQFSRKIIGQLSADLGLRLEQSSVESDMEYTIGSAAYKFSDEENYTQVLPKVSLNYETKGGVVYLSVSKGYLAGGVNYSLATSDESLLYDEEYTLNYELGYKTVFGGGRYSLNSAVFYTDMRDKQVNQIIPGEMGNSKISNAAEAHAYGAEMSLKAKVTRGLTLFTSAGLTKARADEWVDSTYNSTTKEYIYTDYSGNKLPSVPEYTFDAGFEYMFAGGFFIAGESVYTGDFYHDGANSLQESAYVLHNVRAGYIGDNYEITLWCDNFADEKYTESQTIWGTSTVVEDGKPRTYGIKMAYRY